MIAKSSTNPVFLSARTGAEAAARELSQKYSIPIEIVWLTPPGWLGDPTATGSGPIGWILGLLNADF